MTDLHYDMRSSLSRFGNWNEDSNSNSVKESKASNDERLNNESENFSSFLDFLFSKPTVHDNFHYNDTNNIPETIYAVYRDDLNVFKIHDAIKAKYTFNYASVNFIKDEAAKLKNRAETSHGLMLVKRKAMISESERMENEANDFFQWKQWNEYVSKARDVIKEYIPMSSEEVRGSIVIGTSFLNEDESKTTRERINRLKVIARYIEIASQYIDIKAFNINNEIQTCQICDTPVESLMNCSENKQDKYGTIVCKCGREMIPVARVPTYSDSVRINTGIKNSYEDLGNFTKRLDAYEGKQRAPPPPLLYVHLEDYFILNPLRCGKTSAEIRDAPFVKNGKKAGTSISILGEALLATDNSAFYKDIELIAHNLWGWKLADLTSNGLRRRLIADYIDTQRVYEEIKERESSLNVNLRLFFHLVIRKYPCEIEDFKIISSTDSLNYHKKMLKIMCERVGLPICAFLC